jgi:hypothetical protein
MENIFGVNDYAIVDFRRNMSGQPTKVTKKLNRISVFFKNDECGVSLEDHNSEGDGHDPVLIIFTTIIIMMIHDVIIHSINIIHVSSISTIDMWCIIRSRS